MAKYRKYRIGRLALLVALLGVLFASCETESFYSGSSAKLRFSVDTLSFDTVFTTLGSATLNFRIYNPYNQPVNVENILLAGGQNSVFRMNVDGHKGPEVNDIRINANDSAYVFVEVTVDPTNQNLPLIVRDSISFTTKGSYQQVQLLAYGQDAHHIRFHPDSSFVGNHPDSVLILILGNTTIKNDKPYLIHENLYINEDATLKIEPGARVHFRKNKSLFVGGTLEVNGTQENRVSIAGDRLDDLYNGFSYDKVPGQWGYIHLLAGSKNNIIRYADIRNSIIGIRVDSVVTEGTPSLVIENSVVRNCTAVGLYALGAHVVANNSLFANCGQIVVALTIGGKYEFTHCTIGNYYQWGGGTDPALYINNFYIDANRRIQPRDLWQADFKNCIVYGRNADELVLQNEIEGNIVFARFYYSFDHCLVKTFQEVDTTENNFRNMLWNRNPKFIDPYSTQSSNYRLDTLSFAKDAGLKQAALNFPFDMEGNDRLADNGPDMGAYERVEK